MALSAAGIEDISILAGWERPPRYLGLQRDRICIVSPLLMNPNFGRGHEIDVGYNCLAQSTSVVRDPLWSNLAMCPRRCLSRWTTSCTAALTRAS